MKEMKEIFEQQRKLTPPPLFSPSPPLLLSLSLSLWCALPNSRCTLLIHFSNFHISQITNGPARSSQRQCRAVREQSKVQMGEGEQWQWQESAEGGRGPLPNSFCKIIYVPLSTRTIARLQLVFKCGSTVAQQRPLKDVKGHSHTQGQLQRCQLRCSSRSSDSIVN